jgi:hypothetical protein
MKKIVMFVMFVMFIATAVSLAGCQGSMYLKPTNVDGVGTVLQGGRTGVFGTDNSFVYIQPAPAKIPVQVSTPAPVSVPKVLLEKSYTRTEDSYEQGCPSIKQRKNIRHSEKKEAWTEEVLRPIPFAPQPQAVMVPQQQPPAVFWAGGNPSVGNMALPSLFMATGMVGAASVLRPSETNISQSGGGANANANQSQNQKQRMRQDQDQTATGGNANATSKTKTGVDINID